jgi:hypothetical protein
MIRSAVLLLVWGSVASAADPDPQSLAVPPVLAG